MATYQTYTAIGQREDLSDVIYNISPTDTPLLNSLARGKATGVYHEWQTDSLAAATTNDAAVEGADACDATMSPATRLGNYTQIVQKTIKISGTLEAVDKAGRKSEKAYQLSKASAELKRDILVFAKTDPREFLNILNDPELKYQAKIRMFFENKLLVLRNNDKEIWFNTSTNKKKMMSIPYGEDPYEMAGGFLQTDEGIDSLQMLEAILA